MVVPEVGDEVLVVFEQGDLRRPYVLGGLYNGVDTPEHRRASRLVDGGTGAVNRRSLVSRRGHRIDLLDEDGRTEGVTVASGDGKVSLALDATGDEGDRAQRRHGARSRAARGSPSTPAAPKLELKGGQVSIKATSGVTVDGGGAAPVKGRRPARGSCRPVKGGAMCTLSAALVKIN